MKYSAPEDGIAKSYFKSKKVLIICWLLPLFRKTEALPFEFSVAKSGLRYHQKAVSTTIDGIITEINFISQYLHGRKIFHILFNEKNNR